MLPQFSCKPILSDGDKLAYLTQPRLVEANNESIRLGFSRNLAEERIASLPADLKFSIINAWNHTSGEGLKNIRLLLLVGPHADDLHHVFLDVTPDTWAAIGHRE